LDQFLIKKGEQTLIQYKALKTAPKSLESYLQKISAVSLKQYQSFSRNQKLAFLINAYNAFTLKIIIKNYPVDSIKDIGNIFKNTWKIKFFTLLGEKRHLDWIEHDVLRKKFDEPRIHFAVNCASISCPSLLEKVFQPKKLDQQFNTAAKNFLTNSQKNRWDREANILYLSKIFEWYGQDFQEKHSSFKQYIIPFFAKSPSEKKKIKSADIKYLDYNWKLNEAPANRK
jgi:hypothetical protein